jgi:ribose 5-phosphate isomerase B
MSSRAQGPAQKISGTAQRIAIASDHRGVALKKGLAAFLRARGYTVKDYGPMRETSCDYPLFAEKVARAIQKKICARGVLICNSGIGMSMAANKFKGIRAALCKDMRTARFSRLHNDANVLVLAAASTSREKAKRILAAWLAAPFEGGRHARRVGQMEKIENNR